MVLTLQWFVNLSAVSIIFTPKSAHYSLDWGVAIFLLVVADDIVKPPVISDKSLDEETAVIQINPDAPKVLLRVSSIPSATKVGL